MSWASNNKKIQGALARQVGQDFEDMFTARCNYSKMVCVRIPDGGKTIKVKNILRVVKTKSPFDFIIGQNGKNAAIDCKTVQGKSFAYSSIDNSQLKWLSYTSNTMVSGYVVWFRETDDVVFFNHKLLAGLKKRESLKYCEGLALGSISRFNPTLIIQHPWPY